MAMASSSTKNDAFLPASPALSKTSAFPSSKRAKREYQILSEHDLETELDQLAEECSSILNLSPSDCKLLLRRFKWQKMVLFERFYDSSNPSELLRQAGLSSASNTPVNGDGPSSTNSSQQEQICGICWENSSASLFGLPCEHKFCAECWTTYLVQKVLSEGSAYMTCPARDCDFAVVDAFARPLLARHSPTSLAAFNRLQLNSFVEGNSLIKWCTAANCTRAIKVEFAEPMQVKCECGHSFCFACLQPWHPPVSCSLLHTWLKQCSDDSETYNWINAYTKDCPKCKTAIEKNGGCNHMTCRSAACKHEFCWVCMGDWKAHGGNYSCNRYNETKQKGEKKVEESREALNRYLHYYNRFRNHENSLKLEHKLYERIAELIQRYQEAKFRHVDTLFLAVAVDKLCEARSTLMYTYAFAFYLEQNNTQTKIFEDNQQDLEVATEQLSEYLERDMDGEQDLNGLKQRVMDKTHYVECRRHALLQHCMEGTEHHEWRYNRKEIKPEDGTVPNV